MSSRHHDGLTGSTLRCLVGLIALGVTLVSTSSAPASADSQRISDGSTTTAPDQVKLTEKLQISGTGWTAPGGGGSVVAVKLDEGRVLTAGAVANPATGEAIGDTTVVAAVKANRQGRFTVAVPLPHGPTWGAGTRHSVRLLSGRLVGNDATRSVALTFDIVAASGTSSKRPRPPSEPTTTSAPRTEPRRTSKPEQLPTASERPAPSETIGADEPTPSASSPGSRQMATQEPSAPLRSVATAASPRTADRSAAAGPGAVVQSASPDTVGGPTSSKAPPDGPDPGARTGTQPLDHPSPSPTSPSPTSPSPTSSAPLARAGSGGEPDTAECGAEPATALSAPRTVRGVPTVERGDTLTVSGVGFCRAGGGGGSRVRVQIDDGRYLRRSSDPRADPTIWTIVQAERDGSFVVGLRLPGATDTDPALTPGLHRFRLMTGSDPGDALRTVDTGEFVVTEGTIAVLPEPTRSPEAVDPKIALVGAKAGGVTISRSGSTVRIEAPDLEPGDWVFPYAFGGRQDPRATPLSWVQLDGERAVVVDVADLGMTGAQTTRVSLQSRDGTLIGWAPVDETAPPQSVSASTSPDDAGRRSPRPLVVFAGGAMVLVGLGWLVVARTRRRTLL